MATTTRNIVLGGAALYLTAIAIKSHASTQFCDKSFVLRYWYNRVSCCLQGKKALTWEEEERGFNMIQESRTTGDNPIFEPTEEEILEDEVKEVSGELKVVRRRPRRHMRMPYVHYLLNHCRGELGQLDYTPANVKWVERTARADAHDRLVRSCDLARILPHVVAMYFGSRDESQSRASRDQQSSAYVETISATLERQGAGGTGARMSSC